MLKLDRLDPQTPSEIAASKAEYWQEGATGDERNIFVTKVSSQSRERTRRCLHSAAAQQG